MKAVAILLVLFLIAKDASHVGDRFVMRGIAQGMSFTVGLGWIIVNLNRVQWSKYRLVGMYLLVLLISAFFSMFQKAVFLQLASLSSVVIFAIATAYSKNRPQIHNTMIVTTFLAYFVVCIISLMLIKLAPHMAYQVGNIAGGRRFAGLFGRPAMMGAASGILLGISMFYKFHKSKPVYILRFIAGLVAFICLTLSGARTFLVAMIISITITAYRKYGNMSRWILITCFIAFVIYIFLEINQFKISEETRETTLRYDNISTLTGRAQIWEATIRALPQSPLVGFGFGVSGDALMKIGINTNYFSNLQDSLIKSNPTLHNGYVQAIGDSGLLGGVLYICIVLGSCLAYWHHQIFKIYTAEFCLVIFLSVANFAESLIFKASTWQSSLFWYLAVFGFSFRGIRKKTNYPAFQIIHKSKGKPVA